MFITFKPSKNELQLISKKKLGKIWNVDKNNTVLNT